jgi:hypothetical protein
MDTDADTHHERPWLDDGRFRGGGSLFHPASFRNLLDFRARNGAKA